jgi:hypothetical protein
MMKKMMLVLVLMVVATVGQLLAQDLASVNRQIKKTEADVTKAEKKFEVEKSRKIFSLQREIKNQTLISSRADDTKRRDEVNLVIIRLNGQVDSVKGLKKVADPEVKAISKELYDLQQKQATLLNAAKEQQSKIVTATATAKDSSRKVPVVVKTPVNPCDRSIPTRLTKLDRNQRNRSHETRLDELVIAQVENNVKATFDPASQQSGYKVVFDNMYTQPVNFIVRASGGIGRVSLVVEPGVIRTKYLLPGNYTVEVYVNGILSGQSRPMKIDGQECDYKGMACFGYVYMPRF